ncbi:hypothetical protein [Dysgonomonas sp. 511]|uniref:hypothetical protein n=1 Tax=Dysgonomonas sp. 511 TaxID=2302930 RepID=UPI0013D665BB|nr:hypothetical protein [Dysgonomonas sp. 511]NDV78364.1 hypothetical protein [Dysgonomonas sp. 511]
MKRILTTGSIFILIITSSFTFSEPEDYPLRWYTICQIDTLKEHSPTGEFTDSIQDEDGNMVEVSQRRRNKQDNKDSITDICLTKDLDGLSLTNKEV